MIFNKSNIIEELLTDISNLYAFQIVAFFGANVCSSFISGCVTHFYSTFLWQLFLATFQQGII